MDSNKKIITIAIIATLVGLGIGYFVFGNKQVNHSTAAIHDHESESNQTWTCSMHPQIQRNEAGQCPICGMDLIPLASNTSNDPTLLQMTEDAIKLANIQTTIIGESSNSNGKTIRLSGKIQSDERLSSSLTAHVPGRIEKLYVSFTGEKVRAGQRIASIYSPELISAQQELLEATKMKDISPGLEKAARNKLKYWKISDSQIDAIVQRGSIQETFSIYAEASGIVTQKRVNIGDYLKKGEPLFDLMNLRKLWVLFDAYEGDLANIAVGDRIEFTTPALPNKVFKTRITYIDPVINSSTRVASVRTEINNTKGLLKPEMFVNGTLASRKKPNSKQQLTVPKTAVMWTGKRSVVYVKIPDTDIPSFQYREVEIGESLGDSYRIINGLKPGEEVVTQGNFTIDAAAQLNNQASMMNQFITVKGAEEKAIQLPDYTNASPIFKKQLQRVTDAYLKLKDAFVQTDQVNANRKAKAILSALDLVDMKLLKGEAHLYWMKQLKSLKIHTTKVTTAIDIKEQRKQFDFLSQVLIKTVKVFGSTETLYVENCPMAFDNGADWLSKESNIMNPYFGDKMLTCGSVIDSIAQKH